MRQPAAPSVTEPERLASSLGFKRFSAYPFGELLLEMQKLLSRVPSAMRSLSPESFRGGCSFGAGGAPDLSRMGHLTYFAIIDGAVPKSIDSKLPRQVRRAQ